MGPAAGAVRESAGLKSRLEESERADGCAVGSDVREFVLETRYSTPPLLAGLHHRPHCYSTAVWFLRGAVGSKRGGMPSGGARPVWSSGWLEAGPRTFARGGRRRLLRRKDCRDCRCSYRAGESSARPGVRRGRIRRRSRDPIAAESRPCGSCHRRHTTTAAARRAIRPGRMPSPKRASRGR